ncbi:MAG: hypothetical protein WC052_05220 [Patescibacteria group bacterium]
MTNDLMIDGIRVFIDDTACVYEKSVQYLFPKTKKRRIQKKWAKRSSNFRAKTFHRMFKLSDGIIVSQKTFETLKTYDSTTIHQQSCQKNYARERGASAIQSAGQSEHPGAKDQ